MDWPDREIQASFSYLHQNGLEEIFNAFNALCLSRFCVYQFCITILNQ